MPSDRTGEPWTGATYNGFSGPTAAEPSPPPPRATVVHPAISKRNLMIGGVAAAVALGLVFGLWARVPARDAEKAGPQAEASTPAAVPIEVAQPPPLTTPRSAGPMEVLAPDQIAAARAQAPMVVSTPRTPAPAPVVQGRDVSAIAPQQVDAPPMPPPRLRRGAINCGAPASATEAQICEDAGLIPADPPRLSRAERRARREAAYGEPILRGPPRDAPYEDPSDDDPGGPGY